LRDGERESVAMVAEAYASALPGERAQACWNLAAAAEAGEVPAELIGTLENVVALALETGKARELGRAEAERALNAVFGRTRRGWRPSDLDEAYLLIGWAEDPDERRRMASEARSRGVIVNVIDDIPNCDFAAPAIVRRGDLLIGISTGGRSPALASRLRVELS